MTKHKRLYILAGPNGAGKTTFSFAALQEVLGIKEFVNADEIARGLSPFQSEQVSFQAGRIMLDRVDELIDAGTSFAFETTLATKSFASRIPEWRAKGFAVHLIFFWLSSAELAKERVKVRVLEGGHHIPEDVIARRYQNGLNNLFSLYQSLVDSWLLIDNSGFRGSVISRCVLGDLQVPDETKWKIVQPGEQLQSELKTIPMESKTKIEEELAFVRLSLEAVQNKLVSFKKRKNSPVIIGVEDKIIELAPNDVLLQKRD